MLPRDERIGTADFRRAFEGGQVVRGKSLQARFFRRDDGSETTRAAFVVTKKTGKATVRNRLRRRLREMYRLSEWRHDARLSHTDLLIFAGHAALPPLDDALRHELNELLTRVAKTARRPQNELKSRGDSTPTFAPLPERRPIRRFAARASTVSNAPLAAPPEDSAGET